MDNDRLFVGMYPVGIVYADKSREIHGDYVRLAFMPYATLKVEIRKECPPDLRQRIEADVKSYQERQGEALDLGGRYVHLGSDYENPPKWNTGRCKVCGDKGGVADGKCRGCRLDSLAGMYYASGQHTAWYWYQKTGVNPRHVRMQGCYDLIDEKNIGHWTEQTEAVYQGRVQAGLVVIPRMEQ